MDTIKDSINKAIYGDSSNKDTGDNLGRGNEGTTQRSQTGTGLGRDVTSDTGDGPEAKYKPYEPKNPMRHDASDTKLGGREQIGTHEETASGFGKPAPSSDISAIGGHSENVGTSTKDTKYTPDMQSIIHESSSKTELPSSYNTGDNTSSSTYNTSDPLSTHVNPNTNKTHHKDDQQHSSALGGLTSGLTSSSDRKHHDTGFSSAHDSGLSSGAYGTDKSGLTSTHRDATGSGSIPGAYDTGNTGLSGTHSTRDTTSHHDKSAAGAGVVAGAGVAGLGYTLASGKPSGSDHSRSSAFTEDTSSSGVGHKLTPTTYDDTTTSGVGHKLTPTTYDDTTTSGHSHTAKPSSSAFAGTDFSSRGDGSGIGSTERDSHARDTTSSSRTHDNKPSTSGLGGILSSNLDARDNKYSSGSGLGHTERDTHHDTTTSSRTRDNEPALGGIVGSGLSTHDNKHSSGLPSSQTNNPGIGRSQPDKHSSGLPSSQTNNSGIGRSQPDAATSHLGDTSTSHTGTRSHDHHGKALPLDNSAPAGPTNVSKDTQGNRSGAAATALGEPPEPSALAGAVHGGPSTTATGARTAGTSQAPNIPSHSEQGATRPTESPHGRAAEANKGTGDAYEKSTGLAAEGGDFDASRPGAGREADRLLDEHGVARETTGKKHGLGHGGHGKDTTSGTHAGTTGKDRDSTSGTHAGTTGKDTDTKASHTGLGQGATGQHTSGPAVRSAHDDPTTGTQSGTSASHTGVGEGAVKDNTTSSGAHTGTHTDTHTDTHTGEEKVKFTDKIKGELTSLTNKRPSTDGRVIDKLHLGGKH